MDRRKLILFVAADPAVDAGPLSAASHFAAVAAGANLDAEVRLAGDAVMVADPDYFAAATGGENLRQRVETAAPDGSGVSVCPRSVARRGIEEHHLAAIEALPRPLTEILVEVAEGRTMTHARPA